MVGVGVAVGNRLVVEVGMEKESNVFVAAAATAAAEELVDVASTGVMVVASPGAMLMVVDGAAALLSPWVKAVAVAGAATSEL